MWCHSFPLSEPFALGYLLARAPSWILGPRVILTNYEFASHAEQQDTLDAHRHEVRCACFTRMRSDHKERERGEGGRGGEGERQGEGREGGREEKRGREGLLEEIRQLVSIMRNRRAVRRDRGREGEREKGRRQEGREGGREGGEGREGGKEGREG